MEPNESLCAVLHADKGAEPMDSRQSNASENDGDDHQEQGISESALAAFVGVSSSSMDSGRQIMGTQSFREMVSGYRLRNITQKFSGSGYHDHDNTGTYDPNEKQIRAPRIKRQRKANSDDEQSNEAKKPMMALKSEQDQRTGNHVAIKLEPSAEETMNYLAALKTEKNLRDAESAEYAADDELSELDEVFEDSGYGSFPRTRRKTTKTKTYIVLDSESESANEDEKSHHGCSSCRMNKFSCSIRTKDEVGPCQKCTENNTICTLEAFPRATKTQNFRKEEIDLQVKTTTKAKSVAPSQATSNYEYTLYEPVKVSTKHMLEIEKAYRHYLTSQKTDKPKSSPPPLAIVKNGKVRRITTSFCHPIKFNYNPPPVVPGEVPLMPCNFCPFPGGELFGAFGLGERTAEVIVWDSGYGNKELSGGWSEQGAEMTRMCENCTFKRLRISLCEGHKLRHIQGVDEQSFNWIAAYHELFSGRVKMESGGDVSQLSKEKIISNEVVGSDQVPQNPNNRWCSVCIAPAFYECCAPQWTAGAHEETNQDPESGCGLLTCEICARRLCNGRLPTIITDSGLEPGSNKMNRGGVLRARITLDELVASAAWDKINYPDGVRADVSFVTSKGELIRRANLGFGESVDDDDSEYNGTGDWCANGSHDTFKKDIEDIWDDSGEYGSRKKRKADDDKTFAEAVKDIEVIELSD